MQEATKAGNVNAAKAMSTNRTRQLLSYFLLACGAVLIFLGARVLFVSHFGQSAAARDFDKPADPAPPAVAPAQFINVSSVSTLQLAKVAKLSATP